VVALERRRYRGPVRISWTGQAEFEACGAELLTFPYVIRTLPHHSAILDALFVNAEFYPGVLLLRKFGPVDFGLGAAMLFSRDSFLSKVDWEDLGSALADDFMLGQIMQPIRLGSITLETVADVTNWPTAFGHYFRWKKTVFWCRPIGFAAQVLVMPLLAGSASFYAIPQASAWIGLVGMVRRMFCLPFLSAGQSDVLFQTGPVWQSKLGACHESSSGLSAGSRGA